jgi:hypothetical protein
MSLSCDLLDWEMNNQKEALFFCSLSFRKKKLFLLKQYLQCV